MGEERIYLGRIEVLLGAGECTNLAELWMDDPAKRRLMRQCGIDEPTVRGEMGDFALLSGYLSALKQNGAALKRAESLLSRAFGFAPELLSDAEALWQKSTEALAAGRITPERLLSSENRRVLLGIEAWKQPVSIGAALPVMMLGPLFSLSAGIGDAVDALASVTGRQIGGMKDLTAAIEQRMDLFAKSGCDSMLISVQDSLPDCLRATGEDLDAWFASAREKDGRSLSDPQREALQSALLFGLLPALRSRGWRLILCAGAKVWGDGRVGCGFDALSFAKLASKLGTKMPRVLFCPRSFAALHSMWDLLGVFPAIGNQPALRLAGQGALIDVSAPLELLWSNEENFLKFEKSY